MPITRVYPMSDVITGDITVFEPGLQVPYAMTWTGGWQRKVGSSMVVEARYVGSRSLQSWQTYNYNEINIVENGFLNEFRVAQKNLESNIAAGRGNTFAYTGAAGTAPLPIFLAYFNAVPASAAGDTARYSGTNWTNTTFLGYLAKYNPTPYNFANTGTDRLIGNATFRNNALTAGLPANFFQANPDLIGGANIVGNGGATYYNSMQLELRKRLSDGLQFQTSYVYAQQDGTQRFSLRYPRERIQDTGTEGQVTHAFRANWVYELPFGQGRRFGSGAGPWMNRLIGGWSFDGIARIQSGTTLDFGNVRLVGMSQQELQDSFKLRFDDAGKLDLHAAAGHHRQHRPGVQHERNLRDRLQRSGRARRALHGAGQRSGLHRDRRRPGRLRRPQPGRHRSLARPIRPQHQQANRHQGQHERRAPRRVPERLQHAVVRGGGDGEQQPEQLPRDRRGFGPHDSVRFPGQLLNAGGFRPKSRRGASSPAAFFLYRNRPTMKASARGLSPV